jgi:hypothetical protein
MRTVLYIICLLIDNVMMHDKVYICNQMEWGESRIAERQRKREGERQSIAENEKMRDGVGNKFDCWRKYLWQIWESNLKQSRCR